MSAKRIDRLSVSDGRVHYAVHGNEVWAFRVADLCVLGEWTDSNGPYVDDYFYCFVVGGPARILQAPMYANPSLLPQLGAQLGADLLPALAGSIELAKRPLFAFSPASRGTGAWNRFKDYVLPERLLDVTSEVSEFVARGERG